MLVISIFSFSHNVFKSFLLHRHQKSALCGKGVKMINANAFDLEKAKILLSGKRVKMHYLYVWVGILPELSVEPPLLERSYLKYKQVKLKTYHLIQIGVQGI